VPSATIVPHTAVGGRTKAEKAKARGGEDHAGEVEGEPDDRRGKGHRQHMAEEKARAADAEHLGGGEIVAPPQRRCLDARLAGIGRPAGQRQRQGAVEEAGPEHRDEGEGEHQTGKRHDHVGEAHQHPLDDAAIGAGDDADGGAERRHDQRDQRDEEEGRAIRRERMSRPKPSVPRRCDADGGARRMSIACRLGS
jgi:hypothetical protein